MLPSLIVGLISDTHGDIGDEEVLAALSRVAPVTAVRGNVDTQDWARSLPDTEVLEVGASARLYVLHNIEDLDIDPAAAGLHAVIFGHTHKPGTQVKDGVLYVNPGSAGPRRFSLPVSMGRLLVEAGKVSVDLTTIGPSR
jgi:putative phosphoesterase